MICINVLDPEPIPCEFLSLRKIRNARSDILDARKIISQHFKQNLSYDGLNGLFFFPFFTSSITDNLAALEDSSTEDNS